MKKDASGFKVPDMAERIVMPSSSPMRGWEAFGVATMLDAVEPPSVRELPGSEDWPAGELHGGIAGFRVEAYADDTQGAYVHVWGPDRDAVTACWHRVADLIPLDVWP